MEAAVLEILTVCTGNICRSPLAAQLLATRLADRDVVATSAGTHAREGAPMTPGAEQLAVERGVPAAVTSAHAARYLLPQHVQRPDLVLAMAREHRRAIVELDPTRGRSTFTAREFARLSADIPDEELQAAAATGGSDDRARFAAALGLIASRRGVTLPPASPDDDDVIDPIGRSAATYARSAEELAPGINAVERVVRVVLG